MSEDRKKYTLVIDISPSEQLNGDNESVRSMALMVGLNDLVSPSFKLSFCFFTLSILNFEF